MNNNMIQILSNFEIMAAIAKKAKKSLPQSKSETKSNFFNGYCEGGESD